MRSNSKSKIGSRTHVMITAAGAVAGLALTASASVPTQVVITRFNTANGSQVQVPGLPQSQYDDAAAAGAVITWSNPQFSSPGLSNPASIDAAGNIAFYGQMGTLTGPPPALTPIITSGNQNAIFYSTAASGYAQSAITVIARDGSVTGTPQGGPTPSNPNNWVLNNVSGGNGLTANVGMSSSGQMLIAGLLNGPGATTNSNNAAFFTGGPSSLTQAAIRGQGAAGTGGAAFNTNLNIGPNNNSVNPSGQVAFSSALSGGDTVTSGLGQNDSGLWVGSPSSTSLVMRRGQSVPDGSGSVFGAMTTNPGITRINASGNVVFSNNLSTTDGTTFATVANDAVLATNAGGTLQVVAREGSAVGGSSSLATETYLSNTNTSGTPHINTSTQSFNNGGKVLYNARFNNSANITAANNEALMIWSGGTATPMLQTGTSAAPGVSGATFSSLGFGNTQARLNNNDSVAFAGVMTVGAGGVTAADDQGLWFGNASSLGSATLIAREGMAAPGAGGATFGNGFFGVMMNNADMVVFQASLSDGRSGLFGWGEDFGLIDIVLSGNTSILGANYPVTSFSAISTGNGDGGVMGFNDSGLLSLFLGSSGGPLGNNGAIVIARVPAPGAGALALVGLASLGARRRRR